MRSTLLVTVQFLCLAHLFLAGPLLANPWVFFLVECAGLGLGVWAIRAMGLRNLTVFPHRRRNHLCVDDGPYRFVRHPMYLALLLVSFALVADVPSALRGAVWLALLMTIVVKILYEEHLLTACFDAYSQYQRRTRRLVPFLY